VSSRYRFIDRHYFLSGLAMIESVQDNLIFRVYRVELGTVNKTATLINAIKCGVIVTGEIFAKLHCKEVRGPVVKDRKTLKGSKQSSRSKCWIKTKRVLRLIHTEKVIKLEGEPSVIVVSLNKVSTLDRLVKH
jgi:hypothetical protein